MTTVKERPSLDERLRANADLVTHRLDALLPETAGPRGRVTEAMRYSALGGGKRLRPFLVIESARLFGFSEEAALDAASAVEMIHCYSLIHDDLPAMDDSDLRRGRPTVHVKFDDATAVLAGDGLLTEAFAVLADAKTHPDAAVRCELIAGLARASGAAGMVGGQMIDLSPERDRLDLAGITDLQELKTGALIVFSCQAGAILAQAGQAERQALGDYARKLGLAFQIVDDLLDSESTPEALGKPTGQDEAAGKATFVGQLGVEGARDMASGLVDQACRALEIFGTRASILEQTATFVLERTR